MISLRFPCMFLDKSYNIYINSCQGFFKFLWSHPRLYQRQPVLTPRRQCQRRQDQLPQRLLRYLLCNTQAQVAHLLAAPFQHFVRVGQQHAKLEGDLNCLLHGEDAAESCQPGARFIEQFIPFIYEVSISSFCTPITNIIPHTTRIIQLKTSNTGIPKPNASNKL